MHTSAAAVDDHDDEPMQMLDVDEWDCCNCAGPLEPDEVNDIRNNVVIECDYCGSAISRDQYT